MKRKFRVYHLQLRKWFKKNRWEAIFLFAILLIAAFLRLYRIDEYMTFLGDEGRDAIVVRRLLVNFDPILIGPGTSIGNMYLGPLYYYLIAPSLFLANFSPVGPSIFVAFLGIFTCFLVWWVSRDWFGKGAAFVAVTLYSISPVVIAYSRSSWNPNIMPFFALLCIYSVWKIWLIPTKSTNSLRKENLFWQIVLAVSYAFVLQSHYLGLLLAPVLVLFWFLGFKRVFKLTRGDELIKKNFIKSSVLGFGIFLFLMSPLLIFDARHGWNNFSAIKTFFTVRQTTVSARPWSAIPKLIPLTQKISTRLITATNEKYGKWLNTILWAGFIWVILRLREFGLKGKKKRAFLILLAWMGFALLGLGVYKQEIYDHYYGFFSPGLFIFLGGVFQVFLEERKFSFFHVLIGFFVFFLVYLDIQNNPLKYPPNRQMQRAREVANLIAEKAGNSRFNLAVIAERNYEDGYQYFLEKNGKKVLDINPLNLEKTLADILFVVCELPKEKCDPTHSPKAEIANFGWSKIDGEWDISGVTVYKLVHVE